MNEDIISRYLELVRILKENQVEMKPLRKEKKELEQAIIESGLNEISHYGVKIMIEPQDKEKLNKEKAEELIDSAIHEGKGKFADYYDITTKNKITIKEVEFDNNKGIGEDTL